MKENHRIKRIGWLRAAVLGANDGIVSTSSLVIGVAASHASHSSLLIAGVAGLVSGSMSMATGEYVSVSSQSDTEAAALAEERAELKADETGERRELAAIYVKRGLDLALARQVAQKLMDHDALGAHARDELGISETTASRPLQAAGASALSFAAGAALPLAVVTVAPAATLAAAVAVVALFALAFLGGIAAHDRRGKHSDRRRARHVLERPGHGRHLRRRHDVRHRDRVSLRSKPRTEGSSRLLEQYLPRCVDHPLGADRLEAGAPAVPMVVASRAAAGNAAAGLSGALKQEYVTARLTWRHALPGLVEEAWSGSLVRATQRVDAARRSAGSPPDRNWSGQTIRWSTCQWPRQGG